MLVGALDAHGPTITDSITKQECRVKVAAECLRLARGRSALYTGCRSRVAVTATGRTLDNRHL